VRKQAFLWPLVNFAASDFIDLIHWQHTIVTRPPLLSKLSDDDIGAIILSGKTAEFEKLPCHTHVDERHIKVVTEASAVV
jgi:hypothetical protein